MTQNSLKTQSHKHCAHTGRTGIAFYVSVEVYCTLIIADQPTHVPHVAEQSRAAFTVMK